MLLQNYPTSLAAAAVAAMVASLFLSICGNIAAGVAIFTSDLYGPFVFPDASDRQTLLIGRISTIFMMLLSAGAAYVAFGSNALMEYVQFVLSAFNVPVATVLIAGIFFPRLTARAGAPGIAVGTVAGILSWQAARVVGFGSGITETFYSSIIAFTFTAIGMSIAQFETTILHSNGDSYSLLVPTSTARPAVPGYLKVLAVVGISAVAGLYAVFR
jgi:SSS family solute:Na+ symporter